MVATVTGFPTAVLMSITLSLSALAISSCSLLVQTSVMMVPSDADDSSSPWLPQLSLSHLCGGVSNWLLVRLKNWAVVIAGVASAGIDEIIAARQQPQLRWYFFRFVGLSLSAQHTTSFTCASTPSYWWTYLHLCRCKNPTQHSSIPSDTKYAAMAVSSIRCSFKIYTFLSLTTTSSKKTDCPQTSWASHDLPFVLASVPTISMVLQEGWNGMDRSDDEIIDMFTSWFLSFIVKSLWYVCNPATCCARMPGA